MGWEVTSVMKQRGEFVLRASSAGANHSGLCREYGISRKTGYKWLERYRLEGARGLEDRSRCPRSNPLAVSVEMVLEIVRVRQEHGSWGPKKIRAVLGRRAVGSDLPSVSTIARVLERAGLSVSKGRGRKRQAGALVRAEVAVEGPNDLWTVDFKGWWRLGDRSRCEPLTVRDAFSRYVLSLETLEHCNGASVRAVFEELFSRYGLPRAIRSDNGSPFASMKGLRGLTKLSAWWVSLGIQLDRIAPGHPEQNGAHERLHADIARELEQFPCQSPAETQRRFELWRVDYNCERPHEGLAMRTPSQVYRSSRRLYTQSAAAPEYPAGWQTRCVNHRGDIQIRGGRYFVSDALVGHTLGLEPTAATQVRLWFYDFCLGETDLELGTPLRPTAFAACPAPTPNLLPMS